MAWSGATAPGPARTTRGCGRCGSTAPGSDWPSMRPTRRGWSPTPAVTPSVSTSRSSSCRPGLFGVCRGASVLGGVVGSTVGPAAPDHADPGAGEDADRVGVVLAAGDGSSVDVGGPGALV